MIDIQKLPTDPYSRYSKLVKELIIAEGIAGRSEDNKLMLMKTLDVICENMGYNVVRLPTRKVKK